MISDVIVTSMVFFICSWTEKIAVQLDNTDKDFSDFFIFWPSFIRQSGGLNIIAKSFVLLR